MSEYIGEYIVSLTAKTFTDLRLHRHEKIVRCGDCEFEMNGYCSLPDEWDDDLWFPVEPDGFCAWGERKVVSE